MTVPALARAIGRRPGLLAAAAALVLLAACGNVRTKPHFAVADAGALQPRTKDVDAGLVGLAGGFDLRAYRVLVVERFAVTDPGINDEDDRAIAAMAPGYLQAQLVEHLKASGLFAEVVTQGVAGPPSEPALRLTGTLAQVQGGSRHLRFWFRYGGGRSKVELHTRLSDAGTGRLAVVTATRRVASSSNVPLSLDYGGSNEELVQDALRLSAREYARFLERLARGEAPRSE